MLKLLKPPECPKLSEQLVQCEHSKQSRQSEQLWQWEQKAQPEQSDELRQRKQSVMERQSEQSKQQVQSRHRTQSLQFQHPSFVAFCGSKPGFFRANSSETPFRSLSSLSRKSEWVLNISVRMPVNIRSESWTCNGIRVWIVWKDQCEFSTGTAKCVTVENGWLHGLRFYSTASLTSSSFDASLVAPCSIHLVRMISVRTAKISTA